MTELIIEKLRFIGCFCYQCKVHELTEMIVITTTTYNIDRAENVPRQNNSNLCKAIYRTL
jgi:hypothetical protein